MGSAWGLLVGVGCAACMAQIQAQSSVQNTAVNTRLRSPGSGELTNDSPLYNAPAGTSEGVLQEMASRAAVIFVGTVTAVQKASDQDVHGVAAASVVRVDFAVEQGVLGPAAGSVYTMREWAGMWQDSPRFAIGQRLLMLLHSEGPGGLSSPVDGLDGAIPIKATASASANGGQLTALDAGSTDNPAQDSAVDMRWLQAKTFKAQTFADAPTAAPGETFVGGLAAPPAFGTASGVAPTSAAEPSTTAGLTRVLGLLMSWREARNASR